VLNRIVCNIFGHRIDRKHVWFDELDFRTSCRRCGTPMVRSIHGWREFDPERDNEAGRIGHPNDR